MSSTVATILISVLCSLVCAAIADADVTLHPLFTDGIVLQRNVAVAIYGQGAAGEQATVDFNGQQKVTTVNGSGSWRVNLDPMPAAGPFTLSASGVSNTVSVGDVKVGEVWVCGGQSNMVKGRVTPDELSSEPDVRWRRFADFSEGPGDVCWNFARELHNREGVAVMAFNIARSGSEIRQWLSPSANTPIPDPAVPGIIAAFTTEWAKWYPDVEFLQPYTVKGIVWWQGESDRKDGLDHQHLLPAMIRSWRQDWGQGDIPFIIMQLPTGKGMTFDDSVRPLPHDPNRAHQSADLRQAFFVAQHTEPAVAMAISADLRGGTHPPRSSIPRYWHRIGLVARATVYGENIAWSGPVFESMIPEGSGLRLTFREGTANGLVSLSQGAPVPLLRGFAVSNDGADWLWADAEIDGDEVVVSNPLLPNPTHVRYGWGKRSKFANLFSVVPEDPEQPYATAAAFAASLP